ncbi:MAG: S-methyl-5-thioribose-1-phosphate isomerase [Candidatus Latescibacteria bacterium]|nr:S-methyl-5-thioribose-1-phosphate isomerase [Candidatus Latescibacterota bacterium]NIM22162.1 S-methyl-5-thioribose-1-phosphate isomerase [Candidatus Latescibacterota bacterium]NIM64712.1 S-methyl-5-thioribose-1-phosphate isomerase [Candidatus Latescibacterota bacterium]NIO01222.1 S-methyl-5-thioribose-1-phosphate isomerase [Candidatus Latescibacterota bacterium]NIO27607.1 S-methyl-5-thioribose-1-phosphate isomerase [Candidatus Latescibacterota bacterium]
MQSDLVIPTIRFKKGTIEIIDQTRLPAEYEIIPLRSVESLCDAMKKLAIRGAPALGVAGAFGLLLGIEEKWRREGSWFFDSEKVDASDFPKDVSVSAISDQVATVADKIGGTRPTAINLFWALDRMRKVCEGNWRSTRDLINALYSEAKAIFREDLDICKRLGERGAALLKDGDSVLTHCNTGGLATSGYGTALGIVVAAVESGKRIEVYADETRPLLQGSRLTAWECKQRNIPVTIVCEGSAGYLMSKGIVSRVIVGADRIAANGDTANKVGTLNLAVIAKHYGVPFYVAAPYSTVDPSIKDGSQIPIEMRSEEEVKQFAGVEVAPEGAGALNPAFDVTPHNLIAAIITDEEIHYPPFDDIG